MFKYIFISLSFISILFANSSKESIINDVKILITKEERLALAINRYILENLKPPITSDSKINYEDEEFKKLLGNSFEIFKNPITNKNLQIEYLKNGRFVINSMINEDSKYNDKNKFAYNFYIDPNYRVNTQAPLTNNEDDMSKGTFIKYNNLQKRIMDLYLKGERIQKSSECKSNGYFWQLVNNDLIYKYCNNLNKTITVYQKYPLYLEDAKQRDYLKAEIGDKIYTKDGLWGEFFFGVDNDGWSNVSRRNDKKNSDMCLEERILNYIPESKDLLIRKDGGCMLANGDIFCWGDNSFKKVGIENHGQLDKNINPDYVNIPIMLKSDLENLGDIKVKDKKWYNSPYRVKFEKMAMNSKMVCGISPIFETNFTLNEDELEDEICGNISKPKQDTNDKDKKIVKSAGNLYCNGDINRSEFLIENEKTAKSILRKNIEFDLNKNDLNQNKDAIFLKDIAMIEDAILLLSDKGDLFTIGTNTNGVLGINSDDFNFYSKKAKINIDNLAKVKFVSIAATRDKNIFAAIDESDNFYIWGETFKGNFTKPTIISSSIKLSENYLLPQSETFVVRDNKGRFYYLNEENNLILIPTKTDEKMTSATVYKAGNSWKIAYVNNEGVLVSKESNSVALSCKNKDASSCTGVDKTIFEDSLNSLNEPSIAVGNKYYAWFKNLSYFSPNVFKNTKEDFENRVLNSWKGDFHNGRLNSQNIVSPFLGIFGKNHNNTNLNISILDGSQSISKNYSFVDAKNSRTNIKIKIYELGIWNNSDFNIYINDNKVLSQDFNNSSNSKQISYDSSHTMNLKEHIIDIKTQFDENGNLKLGFGAVLNSDAKNQGFGIASIEFNYEKDSSEPFLCTITGVKGLDQMYCWGNTGRSLPIINTGLYDINKISSVNRLFVTPKEDFEKQMAFDKFNKDGSLFLQYPTYINSFDYPFKFK
ncbi:hypothetical protein AAX29_01652 [Aliarcobacter thereius]|uniref:Regulator of chromosome condensation (RCC1) repeat protein n=1 Tax=Aliarcobacter thereius TaxID=544718 RepID=A0A1C0B5U6_9BACT|nr:hypothetical protein [Aliarcobacter thereius]OCL98413.1 hypothetical protein AAX29_01652 [Aliarcobacter thereius]